MTIFSRLLFPALLAAAWCQAASTEADSAREAARQYGAAVRNCDLTWAVDSMYPPLRRTYAEQLGSRSVSEQVNTRRMDGTMGETADAVNARRIANEKALRDKYAKMGKAMKDSGMKIESYTVGAPTAEYRVTPPMGTVNAVRRDAAGRVRAEDLNTAGDVTRIVVLPTTLVFSTPNRDGSRTRIERRSYIYAIRDEQISDKGRERGTKLNQWYFADASTGITTLRSFFPDFPVHPALPGCGERRL